MKKINYEDEEDESGSETASSIASFDDDSRKGSGDDSLHSSQQPLLRLSAMSHVSGIIMILITGNNPESTANTHSVSR